MWFMPERRFTPLYDKQRLPLLALVIQDVFFAQNEDTLDQEIGERYSIFPIPGKPWSPHYSHNKHVFWYIMYQTQHNLACSQK